jgi:hypothetical protein
MLKPCGYMLPLPTQVGSPLGYLLYLIHEVGFILSLGKWVKMGKPHRHPHELGHLICQAVPPAFLNVAS